MEKSNFKTYIKALALILSVLMAFYAIPTIVFADAVEAIENALSSEDASSEIAENASTVEEERIYEEIGLREESVKHFRLEDGSYVAAQYSQPVHIKDADGEWQDIDNTLSDSGSDFSTSNARVKFAKKTTGNNVLFTLHDGNYKIEMALEGANKKVDGQVTNTNTEFDENATELQKMMTLDKLSSRILYPNILDGVDLEYVIDSLNIKENIIVKDKQDSYSYTFTLKLNNLEAELQADGSILVFDPDTDAVVYTIPAPIVYDANYVYANADQAEYTLTDNGNGKFTLTVTVDSSWMNAEDRVFPVVVDPAICYHLSSNFTLAAINSASPTASPSTGTLNVGMDENGIQYISCWKSNILPAIPANSYISSAELTLFGSYYAYRNMQPEDKAYVGVCQVTANWGSSLTWDQFYDLYENSSFVGSVLDYIEITSDLEEQYITIDITDITQKWINGTAPNYGIMFLPATEYTAWCGFIGDSSLQSSRLPNYTIKYQTNIGTESYWTFLSQTAGGAGSGHVNVATGNLVYSLATMPTADALFTYTPLLVYNSARANKYNIYANDDNTPYTVSSVGKGWNLSVNETIAKKSYTHNGVSEDYYVWTDGDGTSHDFYLDDAANGIYKDADGLLLTLTVETDRIVIEDSSHNKRYFSLYNNGTSNVYAILTKIVDVWGNEMNFVLDSSNGRVTAIKVKPNGSSEIQYLTFTYGNNLLNRINNLATGDYMTFTHSSDGTLTEVRYYYNSSNLYDKYRFGYDSNGRILMAKDVESQVALYYTYDTLGRVQTVHEEYNSSVGQKIGFTYGTGITSVRGSGSDDIYNTTDDLFNHYTFDSLGRVISTYSTDYEGTTIYGASSGSYSDSGSANSLKSAVTSGGTSTNYLINGGFDTATNLYPWTVTNNVTRIHTEFSYAVRILPQASSTESLTQYVRLKNGTYTFSLKAKTANCDNVTLKIKAISLSNPTDHTYEKVLPLSEHYVDSSLAPNLTFTVNNEVGYENFQIIIEAKGGSPVNNAQITIDDVMLELGIGASAFNMINMGHFDESSATSTGSVANELTSYWTSSDNGVIIGMINGGVTGGGLRIAGAFGETRTATQTVHVLPQELWQDHSTPITLTPANFFLLSGMAYKVGNSSVGTFGLKAKITCYNISDDGTSNHVIEEYIPFNNTISDEQYVSQLITIPAGYFVRKIEVSCVCSDLVDTVYFDNISLTRIDTATATTYTYYDSGINEGKIKTATTPEDSTYYAYNDNGDISFIGTLSGNITRYVYETDEEENPTYILNMQQSGTVIFTPGDGEPISLDLYAENKYIADIQSTVDYTYNAYGLVTATDVYGGASATSGTVKSSTVYNTTNGFKFFGQVQSTTDENNDTVNYVYDSSTGLLTYQVSPDGSSGLYYMYDSRDRLISVEPLAYSPSVNDYYNAAGEEKAAYTYNDRGWLTQISSATTNYQFTYDDYFGNLTSVKAGNYVLASYTYNEDNGKIKSISYNNGTNNITTVTYSYDALDRIEKISYNGVERYTYQYTSDGKLHGVTDVTSNVGYLYEYDDNSQLTAYTQYKLSDKTNTLAINYKYDDKSRLSQAITTLDYYVGTSNMATGTWVEDYAYDDSTDLLEEYAVSFGHLNGQSIVGTYTYEVGKAQRLTSKTYTFGTSNTQSNIISYSYNDQSVRLSSQISQYISRVGDNENVYSYTYDQNGNITRITDTFGNAIRYTYDDLNQLIREDNPYVNDNIGATYVYTYDYNGNRTSKKTYAYTTGTINTNPTDTQTYTYGQNNWGDLLTTFNGVGLTYDAIGNPINYYNGESYLFSWTDGRRMATALRGNNEFDFTYNDEGVRTTKSVNDLIHFYTLEGSRIVSERWGQYTLFFLYDESGAPIGMQYRTETMAEGDFDYFYFEKNLQGDIIAVYNESGTKLVSYTYDAWGNHTAYYTNGGGSTGARFNPFRYRGYYYDSDMGFYYLNDRYYDSITGRFLTPDDPSYLGANGDLLSYNLYAYCSNNPVMYVDPTGHSAIVIGLIIGAIVGAALGFGTVAYTDYQDDGQVFNGSVKWYEYAGGTVTGAVLGAGVGGIIGAGGVYLASAVSSTFGKLTTDLFAYTLTGAPLGTWEDYALAFVAGGLTANLGKGLKTIIDIFGRPLATQVTKIGTNRQGGFQVEKYAYDVVTRASTTLMKAPWKSFARGIIRGYWHLTKKGYFN